MSDTQTKPTAPATPEDRVPCGYPAPDRLLWGMAETAAVLGVPLGTVELLHRTGVLRGVKCGRHLRWRPGDVRDYVAELQRD